jgi:radical SAM protein with 4Fe4S-binding SPASM domain
LKKKYAVSRPLVTFNVVVLRNTIHELPALIDLAARYDVKEVIVSDLIVFYDELKEQALSYDDELCKKYFEEAEKRARENKIKLILPGPYRFQRMWLKNEEDSHDSTEGVINCCTEPWSSFWLSSDGVVTPCCYWMKPMGDLRTQEFHEIWNNEEYQRLRARINTKNRDVICGSCGISGMTRRKP